MTNSKLTPQFDMPLIEPIGWNKTILSSIEWKRFEVVCKEFFRMIGFDHRETNIGADGGVDIRIYKVGVKLVRELFGIMAAEKVEKGMIITSGEFTNDAKEFAEDKKISLISGNNFLQKIKDLPAENQQQLLDVALEGDYKTPTCPQYDIKDFPRGKIG